MELIHILQICWQEANGNEFKTSGKFSTRDKSTCTDKTFKTVLENGVTIVIVHQMYYDLLLSKINKRQFWLCVSASGYFEKA